MRVILLQNLKGVGQSGQVVEAADGFARNFLLPRGLAKAASAASLADLEAKRLAEKAHENKAVKHGRALQKKLSVLSVEFVLPGSSGGTLYAGLKEFDILAKLREMVPELPDGARLVDYEALKQAGEYEAAAELAPGIAAKFKLNIMTDGKK